MARNTIDNLNTIKGAIVPRENFKTEKWDMFDDRRRKFMYTQLDMYKYLTYKYKQEGKTLEYTNKQFKAFLLAYFEEGVDQVLYKGLIIRMGHSCGRILLKKTDRIISRIIRGKVVRFLNLHNFRKSHILVWDKQYTDGAIKNIRVWGFKRIDGLRWKIIQRLQRLTERAKTTPLIAYSHKDIHKIKLQDRINDGK